MDIVQRLVKFHEKEGVPYSFLAQKAGINPSSFRSVICGRMILKEEQEKFFDKYLKERGY